MSGGKYLKRRKPKLWELILAGIWLIFAICALIFGLRIHYWCGLLPSQQAAERWQGDSDMAFAQVTAFPAAGSGLGKDSVLTFRADLEQTLLQASLEAPEGGSLYEDAWCGMASSVAISGSNGKATVEAYGIGGDFFLFHPLKLVSGAYLEPWDLMQDRVVLDTNLAWTLFGSNDVAGMEVTIGDKSYQVAGVVEMEQDAATKEAFSSPSALFMDFDELNSIQKTEISCYELVAPNPIQGYALGVLTDKFPIGTGVTLENTNRYSFLNRVKLLGSFSKRTMNTHAVLYPYWENAARLTENHAALDTLLCVLFGLLPFVSLVTVLIIALKRSFERAKNEIQEKVEARVEAKKYEHYTPGGI